MKTYSDIHEFKPVKNAVVTIGTFDGVHIGHQQIIARLKESAAELDGETVILTFFPHPRMILRIPIFSTKICLMYSSADKLEKSRVNGVIIK